MRSVDRSIFELEISYTKKSVRATVSGDKGKHHYRYVLSIYTDTGFDVSDENFFGTPHYSVLLHIQTHKHNVIIY